MGLFKPKPATAVRKGSTPKKPAKDVWPSRDGVPARVRITDA